MALAWADNAALTDQKAGPPFTQAFFPTVLNGDAPPLGT
jgi:hypothetical protein